MSTNNDTPIICKRCGRILKSKRSRRIGYGPGCLRKIDYVSEGEKILMEQLDLIELLERGPGE